MRSKEVKEAIKQLKSNANYCVTSIETTKTVLSYIEELEEKWERDCHKINEIIRQEKELDEKYLDKQVIRDKIKYYEDEIEYASPCGGWEREYKYAIEVLKEILGE